MAGWMALAGKAVAPAVTPWSIAAIAAAWAIVHGVKLWVAALFPAIAADETRWKALIWTATIVAGALSGGVTSAIMLPGKDWIPLAAMTAAFNGALWRAAVAYVPGAKRVLLTDVDRRHGARKGAS